jgi:xanthine dehydrogenase YagR molybdenum-binding subunit
MKEIIGQPIDRKEGKLKVTGTATFAAEFPIKNIAYGVTVQSTISSGFINSFDLAAAQALNGVINIMTYKNAMRLQPFTPEKPVSGKFSEKELLPLQTNEIFYNGQHVALVIAEALEIAQYAASLVRVSYTDQKPIIDINQPEAVIYEPQGKPVRVKHGDADKGMQNASTSISETYYTPVYHHNPMEPHSTAAIWNGDQLTLYDATQSVYGVRSLVASMLGIDPEKVRVISSFIGGGFGSKGFMWANTILAPMASKLIRRPVKIVLERTGQMFTCAGRRSFTIQKIDLGADQSGKFNSVKHETTSETSFVDEFIETAGIATKMLYNTPDIDITQNIVKLNRGTPCPTRAPGEAPGTFAYEAAVDELAHKLNIDPVQFRLINYAEKNPDDGKQWSSKNLKDCYEKGAASIEWSKRNNTPGVTKEGKYLVGYGMATATYPANRGKATVRLKLYQDGHATAACGTQDIGTGTYTVMAQIMAEDLGLSMDKVEFKLGDTIYPQGPQSGGSQTMATTSAAVHAAALTVKSKVIQLAVADKKSPLYAGNENSILAENGKLFLQNDPSKAETYSQILTRNKVPLIETEVTTDVPKKEAGTDAKKPDDTKNPDIKDESASNRFVQEDKDIDRANISLHSFGAHFVKVLVDPLIGKVKIEKIASVMDIGKILNLKTAKSQIMGGAIFGIGMALMEETIYDPNTGRIVTKDLSDYLLPVHADMPVFDVQFIDKPDPYIGFIGARGAGEIGITGITAAIVNAIFNATGKRVREIPVTPDKLL